MWREGIAIGKYKYSIKYFDEPSEHGINGGRISKLMIQNLESGYIMANYDRGWDVQPTTDEVRTVLDGILNRFN